jgi:addiction module RelE/StbE family toxin
MWGIFEHRRVVRQLRKLPTEILKRYEKWKDVVAISGPQSLRLIKGFNDEALSGEWKGHRSSRLGQQYRVLYRIEKDEIRVEVVTVTAHGYRRKS